MANMKFQVGDPVFFYTMIDRIPGIIESAHQDENGYWVYVIKISDTMYANNVYEHKIEIRTIFDPPKYNRGDKVRFIAGKNEEYEGYIEDTLYGACVRDAYFLWGKAGRKCSVR